MADSALDEYRRLTDQAGKALAEAKAASDRGDVAAFERLLKQSAQCTEAATALMAKKRAASSSAKPSPG